MKKTYFASLVMTFITFFISISCLFVNAQDLAKNKPLPLEVTGRASFTGRIDTNFIETDNPFPDVVHPVGYNVISNVAANEKWHWNDDSNKIKKPVEDTTGSIRDTKGNIIFNPHTDSIPPMPDTTAFVNNQDLVAFLDMLKQVMDNDVYRQAKDNFTRYELIRDYTNQVLLRARARWELAHKVKKTSLRTK